MTGHLSLYIPTEGRLHRLHPTTKLVLAACLILSGFFGPGYWFASFLFAALIVPLSVWGGILAPFLRTITRIIGSLALFLFVIHGLFHPGAQTEIWHFWKLSVKLEGIQFAYLVTSRALCMVGASLLMLFTTHPGDLMAALAQRGLPAWLTYIIVSALQIIPLMQAKARTIMDAQLSRGLETEGSIHVRVRALLPLIGPLVLGSLVDVEERAIVLEARAFNAKRTKTLLREIPDSSGERIARLGLMAATVVIVGAGLCKSFQ
ncbi:MAG: energy-coupling factor transporter transmembrane component T [Candidatus Hadarchaeum sp.]